jgi:hypothetical protein
MLANILLELPWRSDIASPNDVVVFVDDSFAEIFKWNDGGLKLPVDMTLHSLRDIDQTRNCTSAPRRVVVLTSSLDPTVLSAMRLAISKYNAVECQILTSVLASAINSELFSMTSGSGKELRGYSVVQYMLQPIYTVVTYFPEHVVGISSAGNQVRPLVYPVCASTLIISTVVI